MASMSHMLEPAEMRARLAHEVGRSLRRAGPVSLLIVHTAVWDAALAGALRDAIRAIDLLGRWSADEIALIFPDTGDSAALPAARVLRACVARYPGARGGLATAPLDGSSAEAVAAAAAQACTAAAPGAFRRAVDEAMLVLGGDSFVVVDPAMRSALELARRLASGDLPVLVNGETGSGKELFARAIHAGSARASAPLVSVNCAAFSDSLLESELFGHERGAFTGAADARPGLIEAASRGTLFLDEIGDAPPRLQAELLRVLETGKLRRVGATGERTVDVRVVAATNRDLRRDVDDGRFRRDLFYRLAAAVIDVPPLRARPKDVSALARHWVERAAEKRKRAAPLLADDALAALAAHPWPGNVRELRNVVELAVQMLEGDVIRARDLVLGASPTRDATSGSASARAPGRVPTRASQFRPIAEEIAELERTRMIEALAAAGGVRVRAAALIGMPLRTFVTKLKTHRIAGGGGPTQEIAHDARASAS